MVSPPASGTQGFFDGWNVGGPVASRELAFPVDLPETFDLRPFRRKDDRFVPDEVPSDRLIFFDLETSGLSGGAGTVVFLAAFARWNRGILSVRQHFMRDYPAEGEFLSACIGEIGDDSVLVSYNGKSFDEPLLRTRCILNRMRPFRIPHADLLYAARRLWRWSLPDCSLATVERALGRERGPDIPGEFIPEAWFSYLRNGSDPRVGMVMSHNAEDVVSLAAIAASCADAFARPLLRKDIDLGGLGRKLVEYDAEAALPVLRAAFKSGSGAAAWPLYRLLAVSGANGEAAEVLAAMEPSFAALSLRSGRAERGNRDLGEALEFAGAALTFASTEKKRAMAERRIERIREKMLRQTCCNLHFRSHE
ncbi:MAG: ribonuclease H-like domain-containing protein [Spirochaetes bacterium]|nr:ribonuclease H-like domain-containing protein [Spirochaetota bacterium]